MVEPRVPEPPRVFIDASALIAGVASYTGASRALLMLAELGLIRFVTLDKTDFLESPQVAEPSGLRICTPGQLLREIRRLLAGLTGGEA